MLSLSPLNESLCREIEEYSELEDKRRRGDRWREMGIAQSQAKLGCFRNVAYCAALLSTVFPSFVCQSCCEVLMMVWLFFSPGFLVFWGFFFGVVLLF